MRTNYPLEDLFWECTLRCNARCQFCGSRCEAHGGEELTTEEILSAFRDIASHYDPKSIMINVTGGEPLLRQDLFEVMTQCSHMGFPWGMVSNGILITDEVIEKMRCSGMKTISISLDGLEETHDSLRGVKGGFQKAVHGLKKLVDAQFLDHIQVTTVTTARNIDLLNELYAFLKTLGIHSWRLALVDPIGRASDDRSLLLNREQMARYLSFLESHSTDPVLPVITSCSHYLGGRDHALGRQAFRCRTGKNVASILANGDIYVCPNVPRRPELMEGNVKTHSLPERWENGFQYFREPQVRKGRSCGSCPYWACCQGDSMHTWDFDMHTPNFCYREYFPEKQPELTADGLIGILKKRQGSLSALRYRYEGGCAQKIFFTPDATLSFRNLFRWGTCHPTNITEQLVCLLGHELPDCTVVEFISPVFLENRNTTEAAFSSRSYQDALMQWQAVNAGYLHPDCEEFRLFDSPCAPLGFLHSHPAELTLQLSQSDVDLHQLLHKQYGLNWSLIANPQKKQLAAYWGEDMALAEIQLLYPTDKISDL